MKTEDLETAIVQIGEDTPVDVLLEAGERLAALGQFIHTVKEAWEQKMIGHIERHGPIEAGTVRYYVGDKKTVKCGDVPATVESLLTAVAGDFTRFCEHLASGAIKHGAARQTLEPAEFERLFQTIVEPELREGKPVKRLNKVDERFLRG